jgi:hypothetical protein
LTRKQREQKNEELAIQSILDDETSARQTADADLHTNLDAESSRAQAAESALQSGISAETARAVSEESGLSLGIAEISQDVSALKGVGGAIPHADLGISPSQESLTKYACEAIWGSGGAWTWNSANPSASTYAVGGLTHSAVEIFNGTWLRNDADNHRQVLNNTPDSVPPVFDWADVGIDTVGIATDVAVGIVRAGGVVSVNPVTGIMTFANANSTAAGLMSASDKSKLDGVQAGANSYSLPTATSSVLGGVKVTTGNGLGNSSGTISVSAATTSAAGAMSASDKTKLNGIATGAQVNSVTSVAGRTGAVTIGKSDVGLANVTNDKQVRLYRTTADAEDVQISFNVANQRAWVIGDGVSKQLANSSDLDSKANISGGVVQTSNDGGGIALGDDVKIVERNEAGVAFVVPLNSDISQVRVLRGGSYANLISDRDGANLHS